MAETSKYVPNFLMCYLLLKELLDLNLKVFKELMKFEILAKLEKAENLNKAYSMIYTFHSTGNIVYCNFHFLAEIQFKRNNQFSLI